MKTSISSSTTKTLISVVGLSLGWTTVVQADEVFLGSFLTRAHQVAGDVYALSDRILEARNFVYDGEAPAVHFWADTSATPTASGLRLLDGAPTSSCGTEELPALSQQTVRVEFPEGKSLLDYLNGSLSLWCESVGANFGEVVLNATAYDLSTLEQTALGQGPNFECASITLGTFETRAHEVTGTLVALSDRVLEARNFVYDGEAPAAHFWADTATTPSVNGYRLKDAAPTNSCGQEPLPELRSVTHRIEFPDGTSLLDFVANGGGSIGVWCESVGANFGEVVLNTSAAWNLLPKNSLGQGPPLQCLELILGNFTTRAHELQGTVVALSDRVLEVRNFVYDGEAPAAHFWADTAATPTANGFRLLDATPIDSCGSTALPEARSITQRVEFPDGTSLRDIVEAGGSIGVWCESVNANFGEVVLSNALDLTSLPSSGDGGGPPLTCGSAAPSFAATPQGYNCEELNENFQVRWKVENDQVLVELIGIIAENGYMGFGVSGDPGRALMIGADPVVVDFRNGQPRARDYYMNVREQCSVDSGVCPDDTVGAFVNDVVSGSVSGGQSGGLTLVRYTRPAAPANVNDQRAGVAVDRAIDVTPGSLTTVIWALGPIDPESGNPFFHSVGYSTNLIQFDFGRTEIANNCAILDPTKEDEVEKEVFPFLRPVLTGTTEFQVNLGPSGGDRGYVAVSNGRAPWGIAWYLNDILLPVVEMRRGTKYTFLVNGGDNPSSDFHPFYLTDSVGGGYNQLSPISRLNETVIAGIDVINQTDDGVLEFDPTVTAPFCIYRETPSSTAAAAGGFLEYFSTLNTSSCTPEIRSQAATLEFTPTDDTPDLIYYQCVTHTNLGWKIHVIDADAPSILDVNCSALGSTPVQLTSNYKMNAILDPIQNTLTVELEYAGNAWVGMAFTNGQPVMVGAEAVIGLPGQPNSATNPAKYNLNAREVSGVVQMPAERQTLINATITQGGGKTVLRFTKILFEEGEHPIFADRPNTFLFAHGSSNTLGFHAAFGGFNLLPNQCAVRIAGELQNEQALNQQGDVGIDIPDDNRPLWVAHGACAATAWGILVPLAVGASLIRKIFVKLGLPPGLWFQIHRALNMLAAILTLIAFSLAVRAINKGNPNPDHFNNEVLHRRTGLVIFILTMSQAINGIFRPHLPAKHDDDDDGDDVNNKEETEQNEKEGENEINKEGNEETPPAANLKTEDNNNVEKEPETIEKGTARTVWEYFHRLLGFTLLGFTWWQVQNGLGLFAERFQEENLDSVFWIVVGCLAGSIALLAVYSRVAI
ncbi:hypothetical protein ACA910_000081 [Epithemia clementina (nom. ined.)]